MARKVNRLSATTVSKSTAPGYALDGAGLYLQISLSGSKSWIFKYTRNNRTREMGLGSFVTFTLAEARELANEQRKLLQKGLDPIGERDADALARQLEAANIITFAECASRYIESKKAGWTNPKNADQWRNTLATYVHPVFGDLPVADIDSKLVLKALEPIWNTKTETASRIRGRIESVLSWATTLHYRTGDNPARWKGHLDNLLPNPKKVHTTTHHAAMPYAEIGVFMVKLRAEEGIAARALEFVILNANRTKEAIRARWEEFDMEGGIWTIPGPRMKMKKEHRVPLSQRSLEILDELEAMKLGQWVFPGEKPGKPLSDATILALLKRMGYEDLTVHGFRSTFRDWVSELTNYPAEVAEMALAHAVEDKVDGAYRRGDLFQKRAKMMEDWAQYCGTVMVPGSVVPLRKRSATAA